MKKLLKNKFKVSLCLSIAAMLVLGAFPVSAETSTASTSALVSQIQALLQQIKSLQAQIETVNKQKTALKTELQEKVLLTKQLSVGMTSDEVATLQEILSTDPDVYPEKLVTGHFGPLTAKAVKKFQKKYGIEQAGEVGPKTRAALHKYLSGITTATSTAALPPGLAKKVKAAAASTTSDAAQITICHLPPGNPTNKQTLTIGASAWSAHQKHGDTVGACSGISNATTTPDTTAPVISGLIASTTGTTTATVSWSTNENARGTLWYGTANPLATSSATKIENETLKTSHAMGISGLSSSTTYYYFVSVKDAAGNSATSSQNSFTTPAN